MFGLFLDFLLLDMGNITIKRIKSVVIATRQLRCGAAGVDRLTSCERSTQYAAVIYDNES